MIATFPENYSSEKFWSFKYPQLPISIVLFVNKYSKSKVLGHKIFIEKFPKSAKNFWCFFNYFKIEKSFIVFKLSPKTPKNAKFLLKHWFFIIFGAFDIAWFGGEKRPKFAAKGADLEKVCKFLK